MTSLRIGILSDTHNELARTRTAVDILMSRGIEALIHCGDLSGPEIVEACAQLPFYFVFGNHDADMVGYLQRSADALPLATCLGWGAEIVLAEKRIAIAHGHLSSDLRPLLEKNPDYLFSGHFHEERDWMDGATRRIMPGALFRAAHYSVAILDLATGELEFIPIHDELFPNG